jgi:hypothetical protein
MSDTVKWMFLAFMFISVTYLQYTADADKSASRAMKYAVENAVHDSALALDETQLSNGKLVIDSKSGGKAEQNFKASLEANLRVICSTTTGICTPNAGTFFKSDVKVVYFKVYNDIDLIDTCGVEKCKIINGVVGGTGTTYNIIETIHNIAVLAVIETVSPRPFGKTPVVLRQTAIYEYTNS